ncbi:hypothetical protein K1719_034067 [Acacia pycnantha]|nr:hypothetical protein K1719_034067 [Acacia pycnantha]
MAKQDGMRMMTLRWYFGIINMGQRVRARISTQAWVFFLTQSLTSRPNTPNCRGSIDMIYQSDSIATSFIGTCADLASRHELFVLHLLPVWRSHDLCPL